MKLLILSLMVLGIMAIPCHAETPLPEIKPRPSMISQDIVNKALQAVKSRQVTILTPAPTPYIKKPKITSLSSNGTIKPTRKPLRIVTTANTFKINKTKNEDKHYFSHDDDRTAGRKIKTERTYARHRDPITETAQKSPFKTAKLPRAPKRFSSEPVIIFFQENTSHLEVGQKDVLKSDVLKRLKQSPNRKIAIYGYAQKQKQNPDKTAQLSLSRALLISEYLSTNGITANRIEARSMADETPISPKNRVDIVIY